MLSERESAVLRLLVEGKSNIQIGKELFISTSTVKVYVKNIFIKLDVKNRVQATAKAITDKLI